MKYIALYTTLFLCVICQAQTVDDPVLMTINHVPVLRSEFEYSYNKDSSDDVTGKRSLEEYIELYVNYKLKVQAALDAHLDKAKSFQDEFHEYRNNLIYQYIVTDDVKRREARANYDKVFQQMNGKDLKQPAHIFLSLPQNSSVEEKAEKKARIDSIYRVLKGGADFAKMAQRHSEDKGTASRGGVVGWIGPGQILREMEEVVYRLKKDELSEPFLSSVGYHIVLLKDSKKLEPFEKLQSRILETLENNGTFRRVAKQIVDSMAQSRGLSSEELLDIETERLCAKDADLKYRIQEYHDGLLMYNISEKMVWEKSSDNNRRQIIEGQWVENLRKKYSFNVDSSVLATVNNHSNQNDVHQNNLLANNHPKSQSASTVQPQSQPRAEIDMVDVGIPITNQLNRNTFVIVIANENYSRETKVDYARNDGEVFTNYCQKTLGIPEKNVHFIADATLNDLIGELDWLRQVCDAFGGEASIIFYYAGHGIPDEASGSSYLLPTDGNSRILRTCFSIDELYETLGNMSAKKITVLMDACFSGAKRNGEMMAAARGVAIKAKFGAPKGHMIVLSAAQGSETAYKYEDAKHGLFTYFLLKKLKDSEGNVTMGELSNYVQEQVKLYSIVENGKSQTPSIMASPSLQNTWRTMKLK